MSRSEHAEAREQVLTALRELGEPARFDQIVDYALGHGRWGVREEVPYGAAVHLLVRCGDVVMESVGWATTYRIATDADRAAREDAAEVERLTARWEPA